MVASIVCTFETGSTVETDSLTTSGNAWSQSSISTTGAIHGTYALRAVKQGVDSGTANAAVTFTDTSMTDTRKTFNAGYLGGIVTSGGQTLTVTSVSTTTNPNDTLNGTGTWSGAGNPANGTAWTFAASAVGAGYYIKQTVTSGGIWATDNETSFGALPATLTGPIRFSFYHTYGVAMPTVAITALLSLIGASTIRITVEENAGTFQYFLRGATTAPSGFAPVAGTTYRIEGEINSANGLTINIYAQTGTTSLGSCSLSGADKSLINIEFGARTLLTRQGAQEHILDDLVINDARVYGTGQHTGFPGQKQGLAAAVPAGTGTYNELDTDAGAGGVNNYQRVDDAIPWPPSDTDYVQSPAGTGTALLRDAYAIANYGGANEITIVSILVRHRDTPGTTGVEHSMGLYDTGGSSVLVIGVPSDAGVGNWKYHGVHFSESPTGAAWTDALYNTIEAMIQRNSNSNLWAKQFSGVVILPVDDLSATPPTPAAFRVKRGYVIGG